MVEGKISTLIVILSEIHNMKGLCKKPKKNGSGRFLAPLKQTDLFFSFYKKENKPEYDN